MFWLCCVWEDWGVVGYIEWILGVVVECEFFVVVVVVMKLV